MWIPIAEAAARTQVSERAWRFRCGDLVKRGLARKQPPPGGHGRATWYLHPLADPALRPGTEAAQAAGLDLSGFAAHHVQRGQQRRRWLRRWHDLCDAEPRARKRDLAARVVAEVKATATATATATADQPPPRISVRSLAAWDTAYRRRGLTGLIDQYGGTTHRVGTADGGGARGPMATAYFYAHYHTNQRRKVRRCHEVTLAEARRCGWAWPASYSATLAWLRKYDDLATTCLMRDGYETWSHRYRPYLEQEYSAIGAGDMYVCDHHQFKCFVRYRGQIIRPWLTAIEDAATRVLVGYHIGPAPHSGAILQSIRNAFETWGVPRVVKIDNGKDYDSKVITGTTKTELRNLKRALGGEWKAALRHERTKTEVDRHGWFGILPELGCEIIRAIPYEPQSKLIERFFRTFTDQFVRDLATFCDTSPELKPEALGDVLAAGIDIPEMNDLAADVAAWIDEYHSRPHRGEGMNGRSPLTAWRESPVQPARAETDALALLVNVRGVYKVGKNGVRVKIGSETRGYGQYNASLTRLKGRNVLVAVDPTDIRVALIYTPERDTRRLICRAEENERTSPCASITEQDMREAQAERNRAIRDAKRARRSAGKRMRTSAAVAHDADAKRRREALRATGTDDATATDPPPIAIVRTGFEEAAKQVQAVSRGVTPPTGEPRSAASAAYNLDDDLVEDDVFVPSEGSDGDGLDELDELDEFDNVTQPNFVMDDDDDLEDLP